MITPTPKDGIPQGSASTDQLGPMVQGAVNDTPNSYLAGEIQPLSLTAEGRLRCSIVMSNFDNIWQTTFSNPWKDSMISGTPNVGNAGFPFAGEDNE